VLKISTIIWFILGLIGTSTSKLLIKTHHL